MERKQLARPTLTTAIISLILAYPAILVSGCATTATTQAVKTKASELTAGYPSKDMIINVPEGMFVLKNLSWSLDSLGTNLKGEIVNNTSKSWNEVAFEVSLYDSAGKKLNGDSRNSLIRILGLEKGAIKPIGSGGTGKYFYGIQARIATFNVRFHSGEIPANYVFAMTSPVQSPALIFHDAAISISFSISKKQIGFSLYNRSANPLRVDWNQVSYVDVLGKSHKIVHSGINKYTDSAQTPTVVPPGARIEDFVVPSDYVRYTPGKYGGWQEEPLLPEGEMAYSFKGKSISVFMPLEVNGEVKNYFFAFRILEVKA